nr:PREDICTED: butyrophilin subfamily 3 member A3-like [Apteryx mantelli mantelli]
MIWYIECRKGRLKIILTRRFMAVLDSSHLKIRVAFNDMYFKCICRGQNPLIVLDDYEDNGIRLKCSSERLFSEVQMLWTDSKGENFTGTPLNTGTGSDYASSSLLLKPGSGNSMSCKIIDKWLKTSTESSIVIADVFFPATSPWLAAFVVILLLSISLVIAAVYKLRKNNKITARAENAKCDIEKEIAELNNQLAEEQNKSQKETEDVDNKLEKARNELEFRKARSKAGLLTHSLKLNVSALRIIFRIITYFHLFTENAKCDIEKEIAELNNQLAEEQNKSQKETEDVDNKLEKARNELEFRKARSKAVNITLDEKHKDPNLIINEKNRVKSSSLKEVTSKLIVVATEGFSDENHYWEVEVGDKLEWELGVVSEEIRNTLKSGKLKSSAEGIFSLHFSEGKYSLTTGKDVRNPEHCTVVGVSLDQEERVLSFYNVEEKCLLGSISLDFSGKLYPFFNPGLDGKWLGIRSVSIPNPLPSL